MNRLSPKVALRAYERPFIRSIMKDRSLKLDSHVIAVRSNYCNCLFTKYMYKEAIEELAQLVATLETQVYPLLKDPKQHDETVIEQKVKQLVSNYYLLGNSLFLVDKETGHGLVEKHKLKNKPVEFLKRAAKLSEKYCKNPKMLNSIRNCIKNFEEAATKVAKANHSDHDREYSMMVSESSSSKQSRKHFTISKSAPKKIHHQVKITRSPNQLFERKSSIKIASAMNRPKIVKSTQVKPPRHKEDIESINQLRGLFNGRPI